MAHQWPPAGPLTTVFTQPVSCQNLADSVRYFMSDCMPSNWKTYWDGSVASNTDYTTYTGYFSPGICPDGYTSAWDYIHNAGPTPEPTETVVECCPTAFDFDASNIDCPSYCTRGIYTLTTAYAIQVRWASSDLNALETDPTMPGHTPVVTTVAAMTTSYPTEGIGDIGTTGETTVSSDSPSAVGHSKSLSSTKKLQLWLGIGIPCLAIAIASLCIYILWKRARMRKYVKSAEDEYDSQLPEISQASFEASASNNSSNSSQPLLLTIPERVAIPPPIEYEIHSSGKQVVEDMPAQIPPALPSETLGQAPPAPCHREAGPSRPSWERSNDNSAFQPPATSHASPDSLDAGSSPAGIGSPDAHVPFLPGILPLIRRTKSPTQSSGVGSDSLYDDISSYISEAPGGITEREVARLRREQARIQARRERLMQLQELDEEEERLRKQLLEAEQKAELKREVMEQLGSEQQKSQTTEVNRQISRRSV